LEKGRGGWSDGVLCWEEGKEEATRRSDPFVFDSHEENDVEDTSNLE
jgi:hypothetical protein